MHDVAEFLARHPPFDGLAEERLDELARLVEVEYFPAGQTILRWGAEPVVHARVIRRGSVELIEEGRVIDLLGEGELFGHPGMLSAHPGSLEARAHEDSLCYRLPSEALGDLALSPRDAAEPATADAAQPVSALVRGEPPVVAAEDPVRAAAQAMGGRDTAAMVRLEEGAWGIVTEGDLRRAVAEGVSGDAPVSELASRVVLSAPPERRAGEVTLEMLERGVRHVPVLSPSGEVLGVLDDVDLLAAQARTPFLLRRRIARAPERAALEVATAELPQAVVEMHDAGVPVRRLSALIAIAADAAASRAIELSLAEMGEPAADFDWLTLGSHGRREPVLGSDLDSALAWEGDESPGVREYMTKLGETGGDQLARCGFPSDRHGVTARQPGFVNSVAEWRRAVRESIRDSYGEQDLVALSLFLDGRVAYRHGEVSDLLGEIAGARERAGLLNLMLRVALYHEPPTGFLRDFVVERSGKHGGQLDIKHGGLLPITAIARYGALAADSRAAGTIERLRAGCDAGVLSEDSARILGEAFDLFSGLRMEHQVEQIRIGQQPDDFLDPKHLNKLTRRYLRDAFTEVRSVQKRLSAELRSGSRFG